MLLPFLCSAAKQDDQSLAILAEIHSVSRTEVNSVLKHTRTDAFDVREIARAASLVSAVATLAAAWAFSLSNQSA